MIAPWLFYVISVKETCLGYIMHLQSFFVFYHLKDQAICSYMHDGLFMLNADPVKEVQVFCVYKVLLFILHTLPRSWSINAMP